MLVVPLRARLGFALGALNGILIVVTRVPDIVVTLAMLFVLQGAALLVLDAPGGGAAEWLKALIIGTVADPRRARRRSPPGFRRRWSCSSSASASSGYRSAARGSACRSTPSARNQLAAFRSGVPVARTKIIAYALAGLFARDGRPVADHEHRHRRADPGPLSARQRRGRRARRRRARRRHGRAGRPDRRRLRPAPGAHRPDAACHRSQRHRHRRGHDHGRRRHVRRLHRHAGAARHERSARTDAARVRSAAASSAS